jgi:hypothetical protein
MDSIEVLRNRIAKVSYELSTLTEALRALELNALDESDRRFYKMRPLDAIRIVLAENGGHMDRDALEKVIKVGGISIGKKRSDANVRISFERNLANGNLVETNGQIIIGKENVKFSNDRH